MADYEPGTYVKGERSRVVETAADAVAAVWEGYTLQGDESKQAPEQAQTEKPVSDPEKPEGEAVNGVGTLGTGTPSEADTPSVPAAPSPASVAAKASSKR